jgi:hypothetical protein
MLSGLGHNPAQSLVMLSGLGHNPAKPASSTIGAFVGVDLLKL